DRNRSHWSTSKTPSYTKSVSWHHHRFNHRPGRIFFAVEKITQLETEEINNGKEKNYSGL
ncbi:hypothetical protein FQZ33_09685, partial [Escherichia coli]|uniref:hypothetical protein n=1 Tax=Escherichia coli TaxID=562 RepID=UPI0013C20826